MMTSENKQPLPASPVEQSAVFISVVLPVRNEEKSITSVLDALLNQQYPADCFEIIVCDGCSTDGTNRLVGEYAQKDKRITLRQNNGMLAAAGRNLGFRSARGDVILYVDGHCIIPDRDLFSSIDELFTSTDADCLCRPQPLRPPEAEGEGRGGSAWAAATAAVRASPLGHSRSSFIFSATEGFVSPVSVGAAYKREVFKIIGEYDETFDACEDVEFNWRVEAAGLKSYLSPRLQVLYHARSGPGGLFKQMMRYGTGRFRLLRKHPSSFEWQSLFPPLFVLFSFIVGLLFLLVPPWRIPVAGMAFPALAMMLFLTLPAGRPFGYRGWPLYPFVLLTIYWGLGWGFLYAAASEILTTRIGPKRGNRPAKTDGE